MKELLLTGVSDVILAEPIKVLVEAGLVTLSANCDASVYGVD